jgi:hypothetical protein
MNTSKIMQNFDMRPTPCKKDEERKLVTRILQKLWANKMFEHLNEGEVK